MQRALGLGSILILGSLSACGGSGAGYETGPCRYAIDQANTGELEVECGLLSVPELRSGGNERKIQLPVAIFRPTDVLRQRSTASSEPAPPLIFLTGGPGQSGAGIASAIGSRFVSRAGRDVIVFEQRGTALADPALLCDESIQACRARYLAQGIQLQGYNSEENGRDVCDLIDQLGYSQVTLRGGSYGTLLAQQVMKLCPERLHSVWLDAVVPIDLPWSVDLGAKFDSAMNRLFDTCESDPACKATYPDLAGVWTELLETLPETDDSTATLSAGELISGLFDSMYSAEEIRTIPGLLYSIRDGTVREYQEEAQRALGRHEEGAFASGMYYAMSCNDDFQYFDFAQAQAAAEGLHPRLQQHFLDYVGWFLEECENWPRRPKEIKAPAVADVPVLITSGGFDPITPPDGGRRVARTLPGAQFVQFAQLSHGVLGESCANEMWLSFLRDPRAVVQTRCAREHQLDFYLHRVPVE